MKTTTSTKLLSMLLAILMLTSSFVGILPIFAEEVETKTYTLDVSNMSQVSEGKVEGYTDTAGDENLFTIHFNSKTKIDGSNKEFEDGYTATQRINLQGNAKVGDVKSGVVSFTTQAKAEIKVWWVSGSNGREMAIYEDGNQTPVSKTSEDSKQNSLYISTLEFNKAGTFYLGAYCDEEAGVSSGGNYIFRVDVTTKKIDKGPRDDWSNVADPTFEPLTTKIDEPGTIIATINAFVEHNGGDYLIVEMLKDGAVISTAKSTSYKAKHELYFKPVETGSYAFRATLVREGEAPKVSADIPYSFSLPLEKPFITNCSNLGDGKVNLVWNAVREATSYNVYVDAKLYKSTTGRTVIIDNLKNDTTYDITVEAVRGSEKALSTIVNHKVGAAAIDWNYVVYGPSAKPENCTLKILDDGTFELKSSNNGGKIQPTGADGLGFYYTAIPADQNFTLRATAKVVNWTFTNGQEGFGLMAIDHVPSTNYQSGNFWSNSYMAASTKIEYKYEDIDGEDVIYRNDSLIGTKYSMKLGIGSIAKTGIDQSIIDRTTLGEEGLIVGLTGNLKTVVDTLECTAPQYSSEAGTYNIIGNGRGAIEGSLPADQLVTELDLEIIKNNTGYFITYYDKDGNIVRRIKNYEPDALEKFDSEYVYIGMFTARFATVQFTDIQLTTIDKELDAPAEPRPVEIIKPALIITSSTATTSSTYELLADTNLDGEIQVSLNNVPITERIPVEGEVRFKTTFEIPRLGENTLRVDFIPDHSQEMPPYTAIENVKMVTVEQKLTYTLGNYHRKSIYVSPEGLSTGTGSKEFPYDIYTAVNRVLPGQTIVLMEGTYEMPYQLKIQRGMNGTEADPIRMVADPDAKTRPVLDFLTTAEGIVHCGDWWYFRGFDVTRSLDGQKGFQVSGNHNVLDQINTYFNGNTGIQLSRFSSVDYTMDKWPSYNLILNCTSYGNADSGYEDADGFAAKLTIGPGNVFDGCVAYNNADDGWDLYAKTATGPIGAVLIQNCVSYANGVLPDGTNAGNGNGFKMGGDSISGHHRIVNSIAFNNKLKGIDSNSCPDITVENCISYNNKSYNVALYTSDATHTDFTAKNVISFKDDSINADEFIKDNLKPKGNQDKTKYNNSSCYYFNGGKSVNTLGQEITADMFVSLEFKGITRNADGTINMNGFLELNNKAPKDVGTTGASTPSEPLVLLPDLAHTYTDTWVNTDRLVHWQECECGDRAHISGHTFKYVIDKYPTETEPGYKHNECTVCGYKRATIEIAPGTSVEDEPVVVIPTTPATFWEWVVLFFTDIKRFFSLLFA